VRASGRRRRAHPGGGGRRPGRVAATVRLANRRYDTAWHDDRIAFGVENRRGGTKLLDLVRTALQLRHYSPRAERAYCGWIVRYIVYHGKRHPSDLGAREVQQFLAHLARDRRVSASTQNQALAALLFLYNEVLAISLEKQLPLVRAARPERLPTVLSPSEVATLLEQVSGPCALVARLLYGAGLRLLEALQLRIKTSTSSEESSSCETARGHAIAARRSRSQSPTTCAAGLSRSSDSTS
jgi:hypothetical protein